MLAPSVDVTDDHRARAIESDHMLDAIVCAIAGHDFIEGRALAPPKQLEEAAMRERWIWLRKPA
jgi:hypothetical protein